MASFGKPPGWKWRPRLVGTNGAFGGSGAAAWESVREQWESLDLPDNIAPGDDNVDPGDDDSNNEATDSPYDPIVQAIAQALIGEDPDARQPTVSSIPLSSVLPRRSRGGGGGGAGGGGAAGVGGSGGTRSMSGTRRVTTQAARGASAIGAATAYRDRDSRALAEFGLSLEELDALSPRMRCARILDMAIGEAGHPDEQAMRQASLEQIKALTTNNSEEPAVSGVESIRAFIGELTVRLGLVELRDQYLAKDLTAKQTLQREKGLRQWVKAKMSRLDIGKYGRVSPTEFHQVAKQMTADALRLLRAGAS